MAPGDVRVDVASGAGVDEIENVGRGAIAAHVADAAGQTVLLVEGLVETRIQVVAVADGGDGRLVIFAYSRGRWGPDSTSAIPVRPN